jgi:hypothetical protein
MSAAIKQRISLVPDSAAQELWRVAELGDLDELKRVLGRVGDVDVRNQHGVTALMKAAYHGHEQIVRTLLDHGADANLTRNDRFTALALAAFFGHTETVRTLLEHGARAEVVTRCGASAYMWAKARTFADAARCLEAKAPTAIAPTAPVPAPAYEPAPHREPAPAPVSGSAAPVVIKTLKDPPEIWDLVHEVRPSFNARTAFVARVKSNRVLAIGFFACLLVVAGGAGLMLFRGSQVRNLPAAQIPVNQSVQISAPTGAQKADTSVSVSEPEPAVIESNYPPKVAARKVRPRSYDRDSLVETAQRKEEVTPPAVAPVATSAKVTAAEPTPKKPNNPLSPQLIAPAKNDAPKAKVIQWP